MPSLAAARRNKVGVCHVDDEGEIRLLNLPVKAAEKHIANHGDVLVANSVFYQDNDGASANGFYSLSFNAINGAGTGLERNMIAIRDIRSYFPTSRGDTNALVGFDDTPIPEIGPKYGRLQSSVRPIDVDFKTSPSPYSFDRSVRPFRR